MISNEPELEPGAGIVLVSVLARSCLDVRMLTFSSIACLVAVTLACDAGDDGVELMRHWGNRRCRRCSHCSPGPAGCGPGADSGGHVPLSPRVSWVFSRDLALIPQSAANRGSAVRGTT